MAYQTINPATGELIRTYADITDHHLEVVLTNAHQAFEREWRHWPVAERAGIVSAAAQILRRKSKQYADILTWEMGKLLNEAYAEVHLAADIFDYYARVAGNYLKPRVLPESQGAELHIEPIGVLLAIEPWNFPYYQIARVAAPQLMVGNTLLLKHAENVPQSLLNLPAAISRNRCWKWVEAIRWLCLKMHRWNRHSIVLYLGGCLTWVNAALDRSESLLSARNGLRYSLMDSFNAWPC